MKPRLKTLQIVAAGLLTLAFLTSQPLTAQGTPAKQQSQATLQGHEAELNKLAGPRVSVKGTASGDTLTVNSVMPVKKKTTT